MGGALRCSLEWGPWLRTLLATGWSAADAADESPAAEVPGLHAPGSGPAQQPMPGMGQPWIPSEGMWAMSNSG